MVAWNSFSVTFGKEVMRISSHLVQSGLNTGTLCTASTISILSPIRIFFGTLIFRTFAQQKHFHC